MNAQIQAERDDIISPLHDSFLSAQAEIRAMESSKPQLPNKHADKKLSSAILELLNLPQRITDSFSKLTHHANIKLKSYRAFKSLRGGITRQADIPNIENAVALLVGVWFIEAALTGVVYSLEGKMTLLVGVGYGGIFSSCNIATALWMGWLLRYACLTYHDHLKVKTVILLAWVGIAALFSLLGVLILSGARVRALPRTKSHTDIWNFTELSFLATFTDAFTILFLAIAILSSVFAFYKGATAFSDFIPGFTDVQNDVIALDRVGEELAEQFEAVIERTADMAMEEFEQAQSAPEDIEDYIERQNAVLEQAEQHNFQVREAETGLQDLTDKVADINVPHSSLVTKLPHLLIEIKAVEKKLALPPIPLRSEDLITKLEQETQLALASCKEALMAYLNADHSPDHDKREEATHHV